MKEKVNVVIFGTGMFYNSRKHTIPQNINIVAFIDNNVEKHGKFIDGIQVYSPKDVLRLECDIIILASGAFIDMKNQLLEIGVNENKIMNWEKFICSQYKGVLEKHSVVSQNGKKIVVIVPVINLAGGYIAVLNVCICLNKIGCSVTIVAPFVDDIFIKEANKLGISVWACPSILFIDKEEIEWIDEFDVVWVNSLHGMQCVDKICKMKPTIWWLHEYSKQYESCISVYGEGIEDESYSMAKIYAVSEIAKDNYGRFFDDESVKILELGIQDFYKRQEKNGNKVVIAMIGTIAKAKNQIELLCAIKKLPPEVKKQIECWFIGRVGENDYYTRINNMASDMDNVKMLGEMNRNKLEEIFKEINVVVCTSPEETMCMSIVEGMMNKKICITTYNTGVAKYIKNGVNGYIYHTGKLEELSILLNQVVTQFNELDDIRECARNTYLKSFDIEVLQEKINNIIKEVE